MSYKTPENERAYKKAWYEKNKTVYLERNKKRSKEKKEYLRNLKESTPCADCGEYRRYWVMDFDHLDDKDACVSKLTTFGWSRLLSEVAKCEIVCSNCHRERTHARTLSQVV